MAGLAAAKAKAKAKASPHAAATPSGEGWRPRSIRLLGKEKVAGHSAKDLRGIWLGFFGSIQAG